MLNQLLIYAGALFVFAWGVAHLFPTRSVVAGFGEISLDNRRIITMEWIIEGVALIFVGLLVSAVTWVDSGAAVSRVVYWSTAGLLVALALVSMFTGARIAFLPFRLCPLIFSTSALLIVLGSLDLTGPRDITPRRSISSVAPRRPTPLHG